MGFQPAQSISGTFDWINNPSKFNGGTNHGFNGSVIDGKNQYVNAGLSFTRQPDLDFIDVGLAKRVTDFMSVGLLAKRYSTNSNNVAAQGNSVVGYDGGLSLGFAIPPESTYNVPLQFGLVADNIRHMAKDEPYEGTRQLGGGAKVTINKTLMLYGDVAQNFSNFSGSYTQYAGAAELAAGNDIYARGGLFTGQQKGWGAGIGWVGPKIGLNYGYQSQHTSTTRGFEHAVTADIYM